MSQLHFNPDSRKGNEEYAKELTSQRKPLPFDIQGKEYTYPYRRAIVLMLMWEESDEVAEKPKKLQEHERLLVDEYRYDVLLY
jgi:hypothetical protein